MAARAVAEKAALESVAAAAVITMNATRGAATATMMPSRVGVIHLYSAAWRNLSTLFNLPWAFLRANFPFVSRTPCCDVEIRERVAVHFFFAADIWLEWDIASEYFVKSHELVYSVGRLEKGCPTSLPDQTLAMF